MFWHSCRCGHAGEEHYWQGMQRQGACKAAGCACAEFREDRPAAPAKATAPGGARGSSGTN
jgi:hypothetical protein